MRMESDLVDIMEAVIEGKLSDCEIKWSNKAAVWCGHCLRGYPGPYEKGKVITGIEDVKDCVVFHAGTKLVNGELQTNGGRVLCVTALGETREAARKTVYANIGKIHFEGAQYRTDIASFENFD